MIIQSNQKPLSINRIFKAAVALAPAMTAVDSFARVSGAQASPLAARQVDLPTLTAECGRVAGVIGSVASSLALVPVCPALAPTVRQTAQDLKAICDRAAAGQVISKADCARVDGTLASASQVCGVELLTAPVDAAARTAEAVCDELVHQTNGN